MVTLALLLAVVAAPLPMQLISRTVPSYASGSLGGVNSLVGPDKAQDADPNTNWVSDAIPAWIAYDLSGVPVAQRQTVLAVLYCKSASDYMMPPVNQDPYQQFGLDYVVTINSAPGGVVPLTGWVPVANVVNNERSSRQHLVALNGANWVRVDFTRSTDPTAVQTDLDVYSAPNGASDAYLMMGDSITHMTFGRPWNDVPGQVNVITPSRWPVMVEAAIGGTSTQTAVDIIDVTMSQFLGKYVVLAYGTNDNHLTFSMETLVQKVLAAGKIPVVPRIIWPNTGIGSTQEVEVQAMNPMIDRLYLAYPQIARGPDLWTAFYGHGEWIPYPDVHPNAEGQKTLRALWVQTLVQ